MAPEIRFDLVLSKNRVPLNIPKCTVIIMCPIEIAVLVVYHDILPGSICDAVLETHGPSPSCRNRKKHGGFQVSLSSISLVFFWFLLEDTGTVY